MKNCPIEATLSFIRNKWCFEIIRDLFFGRKRFKDFLKDNPELSSKVLSERLTELIKNGMIEKKAYKACASLRYYRLTEKGKDLNKVFYELGVFAYKHAENCKCNESNFDRKSNELKFLFRVKEI